MISIKLYRFALVRFLREATLEHFLGTLNDCMRIVWCTFLNGRGMPLMRDNLLQNETMQNVSHNKPKRQIFLAVYFVGCKKGQFLVILSYSCLRIKSMPWGYFIGQGIRFLAVDANFTNQGASAEHPIDIWEDTWHRQRNAKGKQTVASTLCVFFLPF